jgi:hypothetical protein
MVAAARNSVQAKTLGQQAVTLTCGQAIANALVAHVLEDDLAVGVVIATRMLRSREWLSEETRTI